MKLNPETLARASSRHPWRTIGIWALILVAGMASLSTLLSPALTTRFDFTNSPEAKHAKEILDQRGLTQDIVTETFVVAADHNGAAQEPVFTQTVNDLLAGLAELEPKIIKTAPASYPAPADASGDPRTAALGPFVSPDGKAVLFNAIYTGDVDQATKNFDAITALQSKVSGDGINTYLLGQVSSSADFKRISEEDIKVGESIGIVAAIIVLIVVFGAVVAGITPIVMGLIAIAVTLGIVGLFGQIWSFSFFTPNLITMMGLAVGIDYSLFIVSRYREERHRGREKLEAIAAAGATASRAVFFSGLTVVLALAGMLLVPTTIFRSLAGGAIIVVLVSVAASMTMLPAILSLLGDKINAGRILGKNRGTEHGPPGGFWDRATRTVMGRPVAWLVLGALFMLILSVPYWFQSHPNDSGRGIITGQSGLSTLPDSAQTKQAYDIILKEFPKAGSQANVNIVIQADHVGTAAASGGAAQLDPAFASAVQSFESSISGDPTLGEPLPPQVSQDGSVALVVVPLAGQATDASSEIAVKTIADLRSIDIPKAFASTGATVLVGGDAANTKDFFDVSANYTPLIILVVLALSFILLTVVFRSLVVPAKAIVMNLLSVGAAYGLIVLIFQKGGPGFAATIAGWLGFQQVDAIEAWLPLFLFSILFGLSMDYHVFLLTRIREEYDKTHNNAEAVAYGLRTTGGIITGAAVIMVAVFAGFSAGRLVPLQEMGFGLAVAVFMDATIVRSILVPSTMRLLGDRNWYLPGWLQWLPKIDVEGHEMTVIPDMPSEERAGVST
ncbi:MAG: putative drug exporter of the superfamily [Actinomycetota bacterium]|nr:putative drug exporter of the superfamily [Actinomycetota bacterium]